MTAVAIDGPAGAGKSTVARAVASRLGFTYVDTGAMYRAVALAALERGLDPSDPERVEQAASHIAIDLSDGRVTIDGRDVTDAIRREDVTRAAAEVARHPVVRSALVEIQRRLAGANDVVMEGRDIGTKVVPHAEVKVFLTASMDERALRRGRETGVDEAVDLEALRAEMQRRDELDMTRAESPLVRAPDAELVDSTGKSIDEVVAEIVTLVEATRS